MTKRAIVTQAELERMRRAITKAGLPFRGFARHPDGSVEALVGEPTPLTAANGDAPDAEELDAELVAWRATHGDG